MTRYFRGIQDDVAENDHYFDANSELSDDDSVNGHLMKQRQSATICSCVNWLFGCKTNEQALHEVKKGWKRVINIRKKQYNSLEFKLAHFTRECERFKSKRDRAKALQMYKLILFTKKRLNITMVQLSNAEAQYYQMDDVMHGEEMMNAMKLVNKNMKNLHTTFPKAMKMATETLDNFAHYNDDLEEMNELLIGEPNDTDEKEYMVQFDKWFGGEADEIEESKERNSTWSAVDDIVHDAIIEAEREEAAQNQINQEQQKTLVAA